ncbi:MAG: cyclic nucleotide-binding domain-containing protein, partial [Deltaproteobacteria bacterium]|nr:cyclic nucleotide-binding domain-containing protein [Deltaproteobacteria bacterium]
AEPAAVDVLSLEKAKAAASKALEQASAKVAEVAPQRLPATPLVSVLSRDELRELAAVVEHRQVDTGERIIEVGDAATKLFWVARGRLSVTRDAHVLGELRSNAFFGEIALLGATDRTARVEAATDVWLLDIPAESVEKLASSSPRLAKVLANYARARILSNVMRTSGLFSRLSEDERRSLLPRFEARIVEAGERFIEAGKANDRLFVVASGTVEVRDGKTVIAELSVGDGVGEQSLLSRKPAGYDVVAQSRTVVLGLGREAFDDLAIAHPGLLAEAYRLLVEREQAGAAVVHDASDLVL